jgi:hypothetical protein
MFEEYVIGDNESFNLLKKESITNGTTKTFSNLLGDQTFMYRIYYNLTITPSAGNDSILALRFNGDTGNNYDTAEHYSGTAHSGSVLTPVNLIELSRTTNTTTTHINGWAYVFSDKDDQPGGYRSVRSWSNVYAPGTALMMLDTGGNWINTTSEITSMTILCTNGTMSGKFRISKMSPTW